MNQSWKKSREGTATQTLDTTHVHCPIGHPVDLDVVYDAVRTCNIMLYGEIKYKIAGLSTGQQILLENLVKTSTCGAVGFFATHDVYDTDAEIDLAQCHIEKIIANFPIVPGAPTYTWLDYRKQNLTVSNLFDYFFEKRRNKNEIC